MAARLCHLIVCGITSIAGILIFTRGFLLSRVALIDKSTALPQFSPQYNKAIILVVDALRYDFVSYQASGPLRNHYHHNKLRYLQELLDTQPDNARLYKFLADPPTTTMQRLKGLTTGSLPTFVDAGSNFASAEITEDNLLDQLISHGRNAVFMGDDTWQSLFPDRFIRSYPYPSFNVHDLHTVDRGVQKNLLPEMNQKDWSLLIGHFLGVDHCGHRYGPNHPAISEKLAELDHVFRSVVEAMDNDTLLLIFGDHGMTKTGEHGGDSDAELEAGLVVYSHQPISNHPQSATIVSQIDLVPTLSLLLGLPIPFSNLGSVIPELVDIGLTQEEAGERIRKSVDHNVRQISLYLDTYAQHSSDLPKADLSRLKSMADMLDNDIKVENGLAYMKAVKDLCRLVWAKFDDTLIWIGLLHCLFSVIVCSYAAYVNSDLAIQACSACLILNALLSFTLIYIHLTYDLTLVVQITCQTITASICLLFYKPEANVRLSLMDVASLLVLILQSVVPLSNSMVVYEDKVTLFLLQTLIWSLWFRHSTVTVCQHLVSMRVKDKLKASNPIYWVKLPSLYLTMTLSVILQVSSFFWACREEKADCEPSHFFTPLASLPPELNSYRNLRYWCLSVPCTALLVLGSTRILRTRGNMNGYALTTLLMRFSLPAVACLLCMHWALSSMPGRSAMPDWQQVLLPRTIYFLTLLAVLTLILKPLAVYLDDPSQHKTGPASTSIPSIFKYFKSSLKAQPQSSPLVYGVGTAFSTPFIILVAFFSLTFMMLHGDGMAPSILLLVCTIYIYLDLMRVYTQSGVSRLPLVVTWCILSKYFFFSTGQQPTMPNIRWDAAFQGFTSVQDNHILPAIFLFLSTFTSQVLFCLCVPLLGIVSTTSTSLYGSLFKSLQSAQAERGEITLVDDPGSTHRLIHRLISISMILYLIKVLSSMFAVNLLRRHLMVWKIFAPAFVFEGASYIVCCILLTLTFLLFTRISKTITHYVGQYHLEHVD